VQVGAGQPAVERHSRSVRVWVPGDDGTGETWEADADLTCLVAVPSQGLLAAAGEDGSVCLWALPFREEELGQLPVADLTLIHWEWVRGRLRDENTPAGQRRSLAFVDALLRRRWRHAVHVEEARRAHGAHDILIEG
jgi:hypothetical protein